MNELRQKASFDLSQAVSASLNELVPSDEQSQFVERAVADALLWQARVRARDAIRSIDPVDPKGKDSVAVLRQIRSARADYLADRHLGDHP